MDSTTPTYIEVAASQKKRVVQLGDELDRMIKLVAWTREGLEKDIYSGKTFGDIDRLRKLAAMLSELVDSKVRLEKANKDFGDSMTREEELQAISRYLRAMDPVDRAEFLHAEAKWANDLEYSRVDHPGS